MVCGANRSSRPARGTDYAPKRAPRTIFEDSTEGRLHWVSNSGYGVRLIDFDLQERPLSQRIGDESSPGVGDLLSCAGPVEEFFASVPGTSIQFAPAGTLRLLREPICQSTLQRLIEQPKNGITLVDASFSSPLHLLVGQVQVVLCLTKPGASWNRQEEQVLLALREAKIPVWGVSQADSQLFPFL